MGKRCKVKNPQNQERDATLQRREWDTRVRNGGFGQLSDVMLSQVPPIGTIKTTKSITTATVKILFPRITRKSKLFKKLDKL